MGKTVIIDLFLRKVVGWSIIETLSKGDTIIPVWKMAFKSNDIRKKLLFHSNRKFQYGSYEFTDILKNHNGLIKQSISIKGNCWDNAVAESFFKSLKIEWVNKHSYSPRSEAELSVFQWIETCYKRRRMYSTLGYKSIAEFEIEMFNQNVAVCLLFNCLSFCYKSNYQICKK